MFFVQGVAEFMEHCFHPSGIWLDIAENSNVVSISVNVNAISMLILLWFFVQIAFCYHIVNRKTKPLIKLLAGFFYIYILIICIEVNIINFRCFLEEPVLVMPWHHFFGFDVRSCGKYGIHFGFFYHKSIFCEDIQVIKELADFIRVLLT